METATDTHRKWKEEREWNWGGETEKAQIAERGETTGFMYFWIKAFVYCTGSTTAVG